LKYGIEPMLNLLTRFKTMHIANSAPYEPQLFGTAARDAESPAVSNQGNAGPSLAEELEKLASLKERSLLSDEEFEAAKSKLLS